MDAEMAAILQSSRFADEFLIRPGGANAAALQGCSCKGVKVSKGQLCGWIEELGHGCPMASEWLWGIRRAVA